MADFRNQPFAGAKETNAVTHEALSRADGGMVYAHALGACEETRGGSSPLPPTF